MAGAGRRSVPGALGYRIAECMSLGSFQVAGEQNCPKPHVCGLVLVVGGGKEYRVGRTTGGFPGFWGGEM